MDKKFLKAIYDNLNDRIGAPDYNSFEREITTNASFRSEIFNQLNDRIGAPSYEAFEQQILGTKGKTENDSRQAASETRQNVKDKRAGIPTISGDKKEEDVPYPQRVNPQVAEQQKKAADKQPVKQQQKPAGQEAPAATPVSTEPSTFDMEYGATQPTPDRVAETVRGKTEVDIMGLPSYKTASKKQEQKQELEQQAQPEAPTEPQPFDMEYGATQPGPDTVASTLTKDKTVVSERKQLKEYLDSKYKSKTVVDAFMGTVNPNDVDNFDLNWDDVYNFEKQVNSSIVFTDDVLDTGLKLIDQNRIVLDRTSSDVNRGFIVSKAYKGWYGHTMKYAKGLEKELDARFGVGWGKKLDAIVKLSQNPDITQEEYDEAKAYYDLLVGDENFQELVKVVNKLSDVEKEYEGLMSTNDAYEQYDDLRKDRQNEVDAHARLYYEMANAKTKEEKDKIAQKIRIQQQSTKIVDPLQLFFTRKFLEAANIVVGGAAALTNLVSGGSSVFSLLNDATTFLERQTELNPVATNANMGVFARTVQFEGYTVQLDDDARVVAVRDENGFAVNVFDNFITAFEESGAAKDAEISLTNLKSVNYALTSAGWDFGITVFLTRGFGNFFKASKALASSERLLGAASTTSAIATQYSGTFYRDALKESGDPNKSAQYAFGVATGMGLMNSVFPLEAALAGIGGKSALGSLTTRGLGELIKLNPKEAVKVTLKRIGDIGTNFVKQGVPEGLEESVLEKIPEYSVANAFNEATGAEMSDSWDILSAANDAALGTALGWLGGSALEGLQRNDYTKAAFYNAVSDAETLEKFRSYAASAEEFDALVERAERVRQEYATLEPIVRDAYDFEKVELTNLIDQRNNLQDYLSSLGSNAPESQTEKLDDINKKIEEILNKNRAKIRAKNIDQRSADIKIEEALDAKYNYYEGEDGKYYKKIGDEEPEEISREYYLDMQKAFAAERVNDFISAPVVSATVYPQAAAAPTTEASVESETAAATPTTEAAATPSAEPAAEESQAIPQDRQSLVDYSVNYQGIEGRLEQIDGDYYVRDQDGELTLVEGGLSEASNEEIGLEILSAPKIEEIATSANVTTDFTNNSVTITRDGKDKSYTYDSVNTNANGETVSVNLINDKGEKITVRNPDVINEIEYQKTLFELNNRQYEPTRGDIEAEATNQGIELAGGVEQVQQERPGADTEGVAEETGTATETKPREVKAPAAGEIYTDNTGNNYEVMSVSDSDINKPLRYRVRRTDANGKVTTMVMTEDKMMEAMSSGRFQRQGEPIAPESRQTGEQAAEPVEAQQNEGVTAPAEPDTITITLPERKTERTFKKKDGKWYGVKDDGSLTKRPVLAADGKFLDNEIKKRQNAIQERQTEEVLQRQQGETGQEGGRQVEQGKQGQEAVKEGEEVAAEPDTGQLTSEETKSIDKAATNAGVKADGIRKLYTIGRDLFGLGRIEAIAQAIVIDRMMGKMAKSSVKYMDRDGSIKIAPLWRMESDGTVYINSGTAANPIPVKVDGASTNVTKQEIYDTIEFKKATEGDIANLTKRGEVLFQIVGENANLAENVRNNLVTAREMEEAGRDAKTIRIATGWERGKDGKWRYEVEPVKLNKNNLLRYSNRELTKEGIPLVELLGKDAEIFKLYPQLSDIKLKVFSNFFNTANESGQYIHRSKTITINTDSIESSITDSIFAHELQHAIQAEEGFARGGNMSFTDLKDAHESIIEGIKKSSVKKILNLLEETLGKPFQDNLTPLRDQLKELEKLSADLKSLASEYNSDKGPKTITRELRKPGLLANTVPPLILKVSDNQAKLIDRIYELLPKQQAFSALGSIVKKGNIATYEDANIARLKQEIKFSEDISKAIGSILSAEDMRGIRSTMLELVDSGNIPESISPNALMKILGYETYKRLAGEVEARNIQERMGMTPEQRRQTLLQETEDVARDEQIVLFQQPSQEVLYQGSLGGEPATFIPIPEGLSIVDGWYSPIEKRLRETKIDKQSANKWLTGGLIGKGDEAIYTGVKGWLEGKNPQEQVSKQEILDWMKDNRVEIVEVVKGEQLEKKHIDPRKNSEGNWDIYYKGDKIFVLDDYQAKDREEAIEVVLDADVDWKGGTTKFPQYQLEGEKENYKEVLVTLPRKKTPPDSNVTIKSREEQLSDRSNYTAVEDEGYFVITGLRGAKKSIKKGYSTPTKEIAIEQYIEEQLSYERGDAFDIFDKDGNYIETALAPNKERAKEIYIGRNTVEEKTKFKSSHWGEPNPIVHLRMNTRTDADGNKVLFLEEIQSDWGQEGKKEGFREDDKLNMRAEKTSQNRYDVYNGDRLIRANVFAQNEQSALDYILRNPNEFGTGSLKVPTAPFVTDTNAWTKLGLKMAMREAVAQGVTKIAWTTGEQQFDRWGTEKIDWVRTPKENYEIRKDSLSGEWVVTIDAMGVGGKNKASLRVGFPTEQEAKDYVNKGSFQLTIQEQFRGTAFEGMNVDEKALSERGVTINSKEDLKAAIDRNLSREKTETERQKLTDRIWERMQKEDSGTSLPRKEGMEAFYDRQVRDVAKALVKELTGQKVDIGKTEINISKFGDFSQKKWIISLDGDIYEKQFDSKEEADKFTETNKFQNDALGYDYKVKENPNLSSPTQQSIDISSALKAQVQKGMPLFQKGATQAQGAMALMQDGRAVVYAMTNPNVTTPLHEMAHVFERYLTEADRNTVLKAAKTATWSTATSEYFARGFERYLSEGIAPTKQLQKIFNKFASWLSDIYGAIVNSDIDVEINDAMRDVYARMLDPNDIRSVQNSNNRVDGKAVIGKEVELVKKLPSNQASKLDAALGGIKPKTGAETSSSRSSESANERKIRRQEVNDVLISLIAANPLLDLNALYNDYKDREFFPTSVKELIRMRDKLNRMPINDRMVYARKYYEPEIGDKFPYKGSEVEYTERGWVVDGNVQLDTDTYTDRFLEAKVIKETIQQQINALNQQVEEEAPELTEPNAVVNYDNNETLITRAGEQADTDDGRSRSEILTNLSLVLSSLRNSIRNFNVKAFDSSDEFHAYALSVGADVSREDGGAYIRFADGSRVIAINLETARPWDPFHEAVHAYFYDIVGLNGTRADLQMAIQSALSSIRIKSLKDDGKGRTADERALSTSGTGQTPESYLYGDFVKRYMDQGAELQAGEFLSELTALMASGQVEIEQLSFFGKLAQKISDFLAKIIFRKNASQYRVDTEKGAKRFIERLAKNLTQGDRLIVPSDFKYKGERLSAGRTDVTEEVQTLASKHSDNRQTMKDIILDFISKNIASTGGNSTNAALIIDTLANAQGVFTRTQLEQMAAPYIKTPNKLTGFLEESQDGPPRMSNAFLADTLTKLGVQDINKETNELQRFDLRESMARAVNENLVNDTGLNDIKERLKNSQITSTDQAVLMLLIAEQTNRRTLLESKLALENLKQSPDSEIIKQLQSDYGNTTATLVDLYNTMKDVGSVAGSILGQRGRILTEAMFDPDYILSSIMTKSKNMEGIDDRTAAKVRGLANNAKRLLEQMKNLEGQSQEVAMRDLYRMAEEALNAEFMTPYRTQKFDDALQDWKSKFKSIITSARSPKDRAMSAKTASTASLRDKNYRSTLAAMIGTYMTNNPGVTINQAVTAIQNVTNNNVSEQELLAAFLEFSGIAEQKLSNKFDLDKDDLNKLRAITKGLNKNVNDIERAIVSVVDSMGKGDQRLTIANVNFLNRITKDFQDIVDTLSVSGGVLDYVDDLTQKTIKDQIEIINDKLITLSLANPNQVINREDFKSVAEALSNIRAGLKVNVIDKQISNVRNAIKGLRRGDVSQIIRIMPSADARRVNTMLARKRSELSLANRQLAKEVEDAIFEHNLKSRTPFDRALLKTKRGISSYILISRQLKAMADVSSNFVQLADLTFAGMIEGASDLILGRPGPNGKRARSNDFYRTMFVDQSRLIALNFKQFISMYTGNMTSDEAYNQAINFLDDFKERYALTYHLMERAGLEITVPGDINATEELYASDAINGFFLARVLGLSGAKTVSEIHMSTYMNMMRMVHFQQFLDLFPDASESELEKTAAIINEMSGRTSINKQFEQGFVKAGQYFLFAPRMYLSRIKSNLNAINALGSSIAYASRTLKPEHTDILMPKNSAYYTLRKHAASMAGYYGALSLGGFIYSLLKGVDDEDEKGFVWDFYGNNFGKYQYGQRIIDANSGKRKTATTMLKMIDSMLGSKQERNGVVTDEDAEFYTEDVAGKNWKTRFFGSKDAPTLAFDYFKSSLAPHLTLLTQLSTGTDFFGVPYTTGDTEVFGIPISQSLSSRVVALTAGHFPIVFDNFIASAARGEFKEKFEENLIDAAFGTFGINTHVTPLLGTRKLSVGMYDANIKVPVPVTSSTPEKIKKDLYIRSVYEQRFRDRMGEVLLEYTNGLTTKDFKDYSEEIKEFIKGYTPVIRAQLYDELDLLYGVY